MRRICTEVICKQCGQTTHHQNHWEGYLANYAKEGFCYNCYWTNIAESYSEDCRCMTCNEFKKSKPPKPRMLKEGDAKTSFKKIFGKKESFIFFIKRCFTDLLKI